jgi:hypothetical protein
VGAGGVSATIEGRQELAGVTFDSGVLPVYVTGRFTSGGREHMRLAFALNGRVVSGGRSYWVGETLRFSGLLPASELRKGANEVIVLLDRGGTFAPIARTGA